MTLAWTMSCHNVHTINITFIIVPTYGGLENIHTFIISVIISIYEQYQSCSHLKVTMSSAAIIILLTETMDKSIHIKLTDTNHHNVLTSFFWLKNPFGKLAEEMNT